MKENRETISSIIGERIRKFRTEQKLSQENLHLIQNFTLHISAKWSVERNVQLLKLCIKSQTVKKFHCINFFIAQDNGKRFRHCRQNFSIYNH